MQRSRSRSFATRTAALAAVLTLTLAPAVFADPNDWSGVPDEIQTRGMKPTNPDNDLKPKSSSGTLTPKPRITTTSTRLSTEVASPVRIWNVTRLTLWTLLKAFVLRG